jgi:tetratricopeptide (TPR) repeat protein
LRSARRADLPLAVMHLVLQLAPLYVRLKTPDQAEPLVDEAYEIAVRLGHVFGIQSSLEWKARIYLELGNFARAVELYNASIEVARTRLGAADGGPRAVALGHYHRGRTYHRWRDHTSQALADLSVAATYFQGSTDRDNYAKVLHEIGDSLRHANRAREAMSPLEQALSIVEEEKSRNSQRSILRSLAKTADALGDQAAAGDYRRQLRALES